MGLSGLAVTNDLSDDLDIERQRKQLYAQGNTILRKFHMCTINVKFTLFRTYCLPLTCTRLRFGGVIENLSGCYS